MLIALADGPRRVRRCRASAFLSFVLLALLLTGACGSADVRGGTAPHREPAVASMPAAPPTDEAANTAPGPVVPGPTGSVTPATPRALRPIRIAVPSINVDASMVDLGIAREGAIEVPRDPDQVGWLNTTPSPGAQGPAVVAGHVDSTTGAAVFARLSTLQVGDEVVVTRRDGSTARFAVDGVRTYPQDRFPSREVYGPVPGPALRLITCGGDYDKDRGGYQNNVVVYAS